MACAAPALSLGVGLPKCIPETAIANLVSFRYRRLAATDFRGDCFGKLRSMEIVTEKLDPSTLESELPRIIEWLRLRAIRQVQITFGVGADVPDENLWTPIALDVENVCAFMKEAVARGSFRFGHADLFVKTNRTFQRDYPALTFRLCHESDMHFWAADRAMIEDVKQDWIARGYSGYESEDENARVIDWKHFS